MTDLATKLVNALIETIEHDQGIIPARMIDRAKEVIAAGSVEWSAHDPLTGIKAAILDLKRAGSTASEHLSLEEITFTTTRADGLNRLARAIAASPLARDSGPQTLGQNPLQINGVNLRVIPAPGSAGSPFPPKPEPPTTEQQARIDAMKERLLAEWIEKVAPAVQVARDENGVLRPLAPISSIVVRLSAETLSRLMCAVAEYGPESDSEAVLEDVLTLLGSAIGITFTEETEAALSEEEIRELMSKAKGK